jgi:hypothetical protein
MNSAIDEYSLNSPRRPLRADSAIGAGSRPALTSRAGCGHFFLGFGVLSGYEGAHVRKGDCT